MLTTCVQDERWHSQVGCFFLPKEVLKDIIYEFVSPWDILRLSQVCRYWRDLTFNAPQWQTLFTLHYPNEIFLTPIDRQYYVDYAATIGDLRIQLASVESLLVVCREEAQELNATASDLRDRLDTTEMELAALRSENQQRAAMTEDLRRRLGDMEYAEEF